VAAEGCPADCSTWRHAGMSTRVLLILLLAKIPFVSIAPASSLNTVDRMNCRRWIACVNCHSRPTRSFKNGTTYFQTR
jgi:hypothetical protein